MARRSIAELGLVATLNLNADYTPKVNSDSVDRGTNLSGTFHE